MASEETVGTTVILAAVQKVQITNWPAPDGKALQAAQYLNSVTTWGVVIAAFALIVSAAAGVYFALTFYAQREEFKLQRTMRLVDDFFNERLDGATTPSGALREGRRNRNTIQETIEAEADRYAVVSSYFDKALFLFESNMLNNEYFLGRMSRVILWSRDELKPIRTILQGRLPEGETSIETLAVPAREYALQHGFLKEAQ